MLAHIMLRGWPQYGCEARAVTWLADRWNACRSTTKEYVSRLESSLRYRLKQLCAWCSRFSSIVSSWSSHA